MSTFSQIASQLKLVDRTTPHDPFTIREMVELWLADPSKGRFTYDNLTRWLLILENADDPRTLWGSLPSDIRGCVHITSRDPLVETATSVTASICSSVLSLLDPAHPATLCSRCHGFSLLFD